jgi:hypothetical protein
MGGFETSEGLVGGDGWDWTKEEGLNSVEIVEELAQHLVAKYHG